MSTGPKKCALALSPCRIIAGDFHGCPYKHFDVIQLRTALGRMSLSSPAIDNVLDSVRSRDYQVACRKQYEARYPGEYYQEGHRC